MVSIFRRESPDVSPTPSTDSAEPILKGTFSNLLSFRGKLNTDSDLILELVRLDSCENCAWGSVPEGAGISTFPAF